MRRGGSTWGGAHSAPMLTAWAPVGHPWVMVELVALDLPGGPRFLAALLDAWERHRAVLPLPQQLPAPQRHELALRMGAHVVVGTDTVERLEAPRELLEGDALVVLTSGTTGEPKGVVLTHEAVEYASYATANASATTPDAHWVACLPLWHVGGLSVLTRAHHAGAGLTVHPRFDPELLAESLSHGATHVSLVPTALGRIDPGPWRRILLGGSMIPEELPANCTATYGMTETFGGVVYDGLPLNGVEVRIVHTAGSDGSGPGRVELRTPTLGRCYRGSGGTPDTELTDANGWFTTGDLGSRSAGDGRLRIHGRADDVIVTGAEKVWPEPVEARLREHPGVADAAVVGRADPEWGEAVTALVVPVDPGAPPTLDGLREWVRDTMAPHNAPKALELRESLPRTALGKLARSRLA